MVKTDIALQLSSKGQPLHFYGANGFATGAYQNLLGQLSQHYAVSALHNRATWPQHQVPRRLNWKVYADDLIDYIDHNMTAPVIAVGHSMGATATILAALKRPELFSQLVLIEPAMTNRLLATLLPIIPFSFAKNFQPIKYTVTKPSNWRSHQAFFDDCRQRRVFKRFDNKALQDYVEHSLKPCDEQHWQLTFPKQWEAKNYSRAPYVMNKIARLSMPVTAIRGKPSIYFSQSSWNKWHRLGRQDTTFLEAPKHGHLFPLEAPDQCFELIHKGIQNNT